MGGIMQENKILHACVVLPTYNEASNIKQALDNILSQESKHNNLQVLVVDDTSPDGTAQVVKEYQKHNPEVHLLLRTEKQGLGAAYIAGMRHALNTFSPDVIIEMDADGQHDPAEIPHLLEAIRQGADFVIGSRYVKGGSTPRTWKASRKLISKAANTYTRLILQTGDAKDCTGGFRAIRSEVLKKINLKQLNVQGYAFQVALLNAAVRNGAQVKEIPIAFGARTRGESKMRTRDLIRGGLSLAGIRARQITGTTAQRTPSEAEA